MSDDLVSRRLHSLDAYRGLVMFFLATAGFGIVQAARIDGAPEGLQSLVFFVSHPEWISSFYLIGVSPWDLIQPAFMFMVGVSMPYSYASRERAGHSYRRRLSHAWVRAVVLVALGVFLASAGQKETNWRFTNVLAQIGLGYGFLFFLVNRRFWMQTVVGAGVLVATWILFVVGAPEAADPWAKNNNVFSQFDVWFLNLFRGEHNAFTQHSGGYTTLNFVPAFVTMLMGVMCGQLLKTDALAPKEKLVRLFSAAGAVFVFGIICDLAGCPIVKRIWTPSWTLFSGGYVIAILAFLYLIIDVWGRKTWAWPMMIVGMNSMAMYMMGQLLKPWFRKQLMIHLPDAWFSGWGGMIAIYTTTALLMWLVVFWMWRSRIFLRI